MSDNEKIQSQLQRILFILENDDMTGRKGLVQETADLKHSFINFLAEYRQAQAVKKARISLVSAIVSGVVSGVIWLLKHLFG